MIIFLGLSVLLLLPGMKFSGINKFAPDYISKKQTTAINGFFTLIVFLSHCSTYISLDGALDSPYNAFKSFMGQLVVTSFLFYSGFGIMHSISEKGISYVKSIPFRRFFKVFYHTEIAVLLYLIVDFIIGNSYKPKTILFSLVFWESVGNSDWYIFAVLGLYLIVFAAFMIAGNKKILGFVLSSVFSVCFVFLLMKAGKERWWYNTIILFPAGMFFSLIKNKFDQLVMKNDFVYCASFALLIAAFGLFTLKRGTGIEIYSLWAISFIMIIVMFTMKFSIHNKILEWFGSHVFSFYILQRIPMIILAKIGFNKYGYIYLVVCFVITVIISEIFDRAVGNLDMLIYKNKKAKAA